MNDAPLTYTQPLVTIYNPAEADFINPQCGLSRLATGFRFTEGPLWHKDDYLLLSDMPANKIFKVRSNGNTEVFMGNSGFSGRDRSMLSEMPTNIAFGGPGKRLLFITAVTSVYTLSLFK